jgi:pentatricopeptide repeat protein
LSAIDHADLAWTLHTAHRYEESLAYAKKGIELDANSFLSHRLVGLCYIELNRHEEALSTFKYLAGISNRHQHAVNSLIWAYCRNGNLEEANRLMNELKERSGTEHISGTLMGLSSAFLGDLDTAFNYLENAYDDRDGNLITLKYSPYVPAILRKDTRFQSLLDRIGFP